MVATKRLQGPCIDDYLLPQSCNDSYEAEQLSFDVVDKFKIESVRGSTVIISYTMNRFWRNKLDHGVRDEFLHAYHLVMSFRDISHAHLGFAGWFMSGVYSNEPVMDEIHARTRSAVAEMRDYDSKIWLMFILPAWQVVSDLTASGVSVLDLIVHYDLTSCVSC